jgi:hypothetical protein
MPEEAPFPFAANIQVILQFLPDKGQLKRADERIFPVRDVAWRWFPRLLTYRCVNQTTTPSFGGVLLFFVFHSDLIDG